MTTAIGAYATPALVKARLGSDATWSSDDTALLSTLCDQLNNWIESTVGRALAPRPETTILLDGIMAEDGESLLPVVFGVNEIASTSATLTLEIAPRTGGTFVTVPRTDWFLRPLAINRRPGWPATVIRLTDAPSAGNTSGNRFWPGYENVRISGPAGTFGWPAIPDEITELAVTAVVRAWSARQAGQTDVIGSDEYGKPIVSRYVSGRDRDTLRRYDAHPQTAGGERTTAGIG